MGRYKKYKTDAALRRAVEDYFASISRVRVLTEAKYTGERDKYGHAVMKMVPVKNNKGEDMTELEYVIPPTVGGLCRHLAVSRETWSQYCKDPAFEETATWAREQLRLYLDHQLLVRDGRNLQGVIFSLQNNYGMSEKKIVELGPKAARAVAGTGLSEREALLRQLSEELSDDGPDGGAAAAGTAE